MYWRPKSLVPKSARVLSVHEVELQSDGLSTIHSPELMSAPDTDWVVEYEPPPELEIDTWKLLEPVLVTLAVIVSPGATATDVISYIGLG